jgi:hypothetical protein
VKELTQTPYRISRDSEGFPRIPLTLGIQPHLGSFKERQVKSRLTFTESRCYAKTISSKNPVGEPTKNEIDAFNLIQTVLVPTNRVC